MLEKIRLANSTKLRCPFGHPNTITVTGAATRSWPYASIVGDAAFWKLRRAGRALGLLSYLRTTYRPLFEAMPRLSTGPHGRGGDFSSDTRRYLMMMRSNSKPRAVGTSRSQPDGEVYPHHSSALENIFRTSDRAHFCINKCFYAWQSQHGSILVGDYSCSSNVCSRFKTHSTTIVHAA